MVKRLVKGLALLLLLAGLGLGLTLAWLMYQPAPPKRAFVNGQVLTMDSDGRVAEALLTEDGRIVAVGSNADIQALVDSSTEVTDLAGRTLMPGFVDAHSHFPATGLTELSVDLNSPPIGDITSIVQIQNKLRAKAADTPPGQWIIGIGYDDSLVAEHRHPTRADLDTVTTDHPIFLMHVSGHMGAVNSPALALGGITQQTPDPTDGVIVRDAEGNATGVLMEKAADPVRNLAFDLGLGQFATMINYAGEEYARAGITTAQSGGAAGQLLKTLSLAVKLNRVPIRVAALPFFHQNQAPLLSGEMDLASMRTHRFAAPGVKLVADGSIQGFTGYLAQPYHTPFEGDPDYRGYPLMAPETLNEQVLKLHTMGHQLAIHANGDAAIDLVINAFANAQEAFPRSDARPVIIHAQMARDDQLDRMVELGMSPSFFSAHTYYWGDRHRDIFMGPERARRMSPARSALDRNLRFTVHLDSPVVPMQPWLLAWSTVNRITSSGRSIGPEQQVPAMAALRAMTIDAAWQIGEEDNRGSLEPGKWADLIIVSADPLTQPQRLRNIEVTETVVGGRTVYQQAQ